MLYLSPCVHLEGSIFFTDGDQQLDFYRKIEKAAAMHSSADCHNGGMILKTLYNISAIRTGLK